MESDNEFSGDSSSITDTEQYMMEDSEEEELEGGIDMKKLVAGEDTQSKLSVKSKSAPFSLKKKRIRSLAAINIANTQARDFKKFNQYRRNYAQIY